MPDSEVLQMPACARSPPHCMMSTEKSRQAKLGQLVRQPHVEGLQIVMQQDNSLAYGPHANAPCDALRRLHVAKADSGH